MDEDLRAEIRALIKANHGDETDDAEKELVIDTLNTDDVLEGEESSGIESYQSQGIRSFGKQNLYLSGEKFPDQLELMQFSLQPDHKLTGCKRKLSGFEEKKKTNIPFFLM